MRQSLSTQFGRSLFLGPFICLTCLNFHPQLFERTFIARRGHASRANRLVGSKVFHQMNAACSQTSSPTLTVSECQPLYLNRFSTPPQHESALRYLMAIISRRLMDQGRLQQLRQRSLPAGIFAIVGFVELRFNPFHPPKLFACPMWVLLKVAVSLGKITVYRRLRGVY